MSIMKLLKLNFKKTNKPIKTDRNELVSNTVNNSIQQEPEYEIVEKEILPEKMLCPDCGGITLVGLDYCDKCGGELTSHDC